MISCTIYFVDNINNKPNFLFFSLYLNIRLLLTRTLFAVAFLFSMKMNDIFDQQKDSPELI